MNKLTSSRKIYIMQSSIPNAGRGVFARQTINKKELIEKCPFIDIPANDLANLRASFLTTYFFFYGKHKKQLLIALGFGSIYNHSSKPNATFKIKDADKTINIIALKQINKSEEISFNYNQTNRKSLHPLWFETN